MEITESPFTAIIADIVKNNQNLTPKLQDAIADYLTVQISPRITFSGNWIKESVGKINPNMVGEL